jgi:hypothetical protein
MMVSIGIASAIFAVVLTSYAIIFRSCTAMDDYSYQANEELRTVDYLSRDLRSALSVTISNAGQTLALTLPDAYGTYDANGNPTSAPVSPAIVSGAPVYGNAAQPVSVTYYVSGSSLLRLQVVPSINQTTTNVIARNVNSFQMNFVPLSTVVNFTLTFTPRYHTGVQSLGPGTTVAGTVATRMLRIK